jgi:hypothetical protein
VLPDSSEERKVVNKENKNLVNISNNPPEP